MLGDIFDFNKTSEDFSDSNKVSKHLLDLNGAIRGIGFISNNLNLRLPLSELKQN
ncbi:hypothetical protein bthur0013_66930 [Bacillus thuringiensis IBL 200]|nr:hypothetical protein bthur0013_66930 [Bacillus thuringiensis IBL 200]